MPRSTNWVCLLLCYSDKHIYIVLLLTALFYYTLGNIPPKYRSSLGAIQLFAVLRTTTLEKYGCNQVLEQFMDHVHLLESVNLAHPIFFQCSILLFITMYRKRGLIFLSMVHLTSLEERYL